MDVYLLRHGESLHNSGRSTSTDSELTQLGQEQATLAAERLSALGIEFLYCSPQVRALETAEILRQHLDLQPIVCLKLSERCFCWDEPGLPRSEMARKFPFHILPEEIDEEGWARHWSRETREELYERVAPVALDIRERARQNPEGAIAVVIHGGAGDMLLHHLFEVPITASVRFHHDNCAITQVHFEQDGQIKLICLNDKQHLKQLDISC